MFLDKSVNLPSLSHNNRDGENEERVARYLWGRYRVKLLSEFSTVNFKLALECEYGHRFYSQWGRIRIKHINDVSYVCPHCKKICGVAFQISMKVLDNKTIDLFKKERYFRTECSDEMLSYYFELLQVCPDKHIYSSKVRIKGIEDGHIYITTIQSVRSGTKRPYFCPEYVDSYMRSVGLKPLARYQQSQKKIPFVCDDCGQTHAILFNNVLKGVRCGKCQPSGFRVNEPALLYYLEFPDNHYKIGVTGKTIKSRYVNESKPYKVLWTVKAKGRVCLDIEGLIKRRFKSDRYKGRKSFLYTGDSELFTRNILGNNKTKLREILQKPFVVNKRKVDYSDLIEKPCNMRPMGYSEKLCNSAHFALKYSYTGNLKKFHFG